MKARINHFINKIFYTPQPLPAGASNSVIELDGQPHRLHLRIDHEGNSILIINAATVLHLNQTATEIAFYVSKQMSNDEIASELQKRYQVSYETATQDVENFKIRISTLINTPDLDPETFLDMDRTIRHSSVLSAPLRLDCALTYQTPTEDSEKYAPMDKVDRYLETEDWEKILSSAWDWGIPHVVFTGGEPTLRPDLRDLIGYAEKLGQVTGLITDGLRLAEKDYLTQLLDAGLDHLMIVLDESQEQAWEAIRDAFNEDIHLTVHLIIRSDDTQIYLKTLDKLSSIGVQNLSLSSPSKAYESALLLVNQRAIEKGFSQIYELPVPYSSLNPVSLELSYDQSELEGPGRSWLYVEPDGDVLPGQGIMAPLGNILSDSWMNISANRKEYLSR